MDREFEYDPLNRLTYANGRESTSQSGDNYLYTNAPAPGSPNASNVRAYQQEYSYDKLGNINQLKQLGTNGFTRNFNYNSGVNTLYDVRDSSNGLIKDFTHDSCGNQLTEGDSRNYYWNHANQLICYSNKTGSADPTIFTQYDYSGQDRLSKLVRTGTATNPIYERTIYIDGVFEYHIFENGTSTYEKNYVQITDGQSRIAEIRIGTAFPGDIGDTVVYNIENLIGSSSVRLNSSGSEIDKEEYYPFGDSSLRTFTSKRYRYVGKEKDSESGLYYYGARYYSAWTCRFISVDSLATKYNQLTPYNYAGNNPINDYDIDGNQGVKTEGGGDTKSSVNSGGASSDSPSTPTVNPPNTLGNEGIPTVGGEPKVKEVQLQGVEVTAEKKGWAKFWSAAKSFVGGLVKGLVVGVVIGAVAALVLATGGIAGAILVGAAAAYGVYQLGKTGYEVISGKEAYTGRKLSTDERAERAGEAIGGIIGGGIGGRLGGRIFRGKTPKTEESNSSETSTQESSTPPSSELKNGHLAGKTHPKTGVPYDENGFPNFSEHLYKNGSNDVIIEPSTSRSGDFSAANKAAGYKSTPKGYTWHHHQNHGRMQLVETGVHSKTGHTGGYTIWGAGRKNP